MKFKVLIGIIVSIIFASGIAGFVAVNSNNVASTLAQKAPDCKYPPCD